MRHSDQNRFLACPLPNILWMVLLATFTLTSARADVLLGKEAYAIADYQQALRHFTEPAAQGDAEAQLYMGLMYRGGEGVDVDHRQAVEWYRRAAEQGHPRAQTNLAISYALGRGVVQDWQQARDWYLRAARQGYTDAQVRLGELYSASRGMASDPVQAYAWYSMALRDETICTCISGYRDELAAGMSAAEIGQAERLLSEWSQSAKTDGTGNAHGINHGQQPVRLTGRKFSQP